VLREIAFLFKKIANGFNKVALAETSYLNIVCLATERCFCIIGG